jgi:hypothetical protein
MFKLKFKETLGLPNTVINSTANTTSLAIPEDATLDQLTDEITGLVAQEDTNHYRLGQIYNFIRDKKLPQKNGFKDAKDFFSKKFANLSQTSLTLYGAVAEVFTEPTSRLFGVTCLYLLLTYKEAAGIQVNHEEPGDTPIEVPDAKGHVSTMPFKDCTVDQMRKALQRLRKPTSSKPLPPEVEAEADQFRDAVLARFPKGKGTRVKVGLRNEAGTGVLDFVGIPVSQARLLMEALQSLLSS